MKRLLILSCSLLLSFAADAQTRDTTVNPPALSDYAWGFPIRISEDASFYSVELPLAVNRSVTDPDLRDAGVYNGDGKPVPRVFEQANVDEERTERSNPLPMLPLYRSAESRADENRLLIERDGDSTRFKFDLEDLLAPDEGERLVAYIVDTRQSEDNAVALDLVWAQMEPGFMGRVMVDGGNDLQTWSPAGSAVVAFLRESAASIEQRRVNLRRADYDFLRIRWDGMPENWRLSQVMGVHVEGAADSVRNLITLESSGADPDDGGRLFSLGGAPVVDQVRVVLPVPNTVVSAVVYYWSATRDRWLQAGHGSYHHIGRDNNSVMSDPLAIDNTRTNQFKVVITRGPFDVAMQLEVGWRPDSLLFLAQGQSPFTLATGNANDADEQFPQHRIYGARSLVKLSEDNGGVLAAALGPRYVLGGPARLISIRPFNWRTIVLWLGLLLGVAFVGFMASKTVRELRSQ